MKSKLILATSLALMLATAGTTFAASGSEQGTETGRGGERPYGNHQQAVDEDGDGIDDVTGKTISDKRPQGEQRPQPIDEDGDGLDDVTGETIPSKPVDEDGDGLDDVTGETMPGQPVDEDGDGIDDVTGETIRGGDVSGQHPQGGSEMQRTRK